MASATITGQHIEEVELQYNQEKMEELGLTEDKCETNDSSEQSSSISWII